MDSKERARFADSLFLAYLAECECGAKPDFEDLIRRHPEVQDELRARYALYRDFGSLVGRAAPAAPSEIPPEIEDDDAELPGDALVPDQRIALGRYAYRGVVGEGAQGFVLRVWDRQLRCHAAMKVVRRGTPEEMKARDWRLRREAEITAKLTHPNVVSVHEFGSDGDGRAYFVMSLIDNAHTLEALIRKLEAGQATERAVLNVLLRVCDAVAYAHSHGIVHRDLKPENILVGQFGEVYVTDWGLARLVGRNADDESNRQSDREIHARLQQLAFDQSIGEGPIGTVPYMAPEQAGYDRRAIDERADVFAVGAILYRALAGRAPYRQHDNELVGAVLARVAAGQWEPLHPRARRKRRELAAIQARAMAVAPDDRYRDMMALRDDLASFLETRVVRAYESGAWPEFRKRVQRHAAAAVTAAVGMAVLLAALFVFLVILAAKNADLSRSTSDEREARLRAEATATRAASICLGMPPADGIAQLRKEIAEPHAPASAFLALTYLLLGEGRSLESLEVARRGLELFPTSAALHHNLGRSIDDTGGREIDAAMAYETAAALDPTLWLSWTNATGSWMLVALEFEEGSAARTDINTRALVFAEQAWSLRPSEPTIAMNLAGCLVNYGLYDAALALILDTALRDDTELVCTIALQLLDGLEAASERPDIVRTLRVIVSVCSQVHSHSC